MAAQPMHNLDAIDENSSRHGQYSVDCHLASFATTRALSITFPAKLHGNTFRRVNML